MTLIPSQLIIVRTHDNRLIRGTVLRSEPTVQGTRVKIRSGDLLLNVSMRDIQDVPEVS